MTSISPAYGGTQTTTGSPIVKYVTAMTDQLIATLPDSEQLSLEECRGIIARYTAVLEGNFIYWMTGALLATRSTEANSKILENLHEEVRDSHPNMMRKFALAANAFPTEADSVEMSQDLTNVRLFIGRLSPIPILVMMAFFEGFIQRFMPFLAAVAQNRGSSEMEYTDVHGVCDIGHTEELFRALEAEMALQPPESTTNLFEGVDLLSALLKTILGQPATSVQTA